MSYTKEDLTSIIESGLPLSIDELIAISDSIGNTDIVLKVIVESGITSNMSGVCIKWIQECLLPVSLCVLKVAGYQFNTKELGTFLSYPNWIEFYPRSYEIAIQNLFKDNSIMYRKWVRYAESVRSL